MKLVNDFDNPFVNPNDNKNVTFRDEKNRSKLINFLDRVGSYTNFDKDMVLRVYIDSDNDFCAFESEKYQMCFVNTSHKLIDMMSDWRLLYPITISELRSMIAASIV